MTKTIQIDGLNYVAIFPKEHERLMEIEALFRHLYQFSNNFPMKLDSFHTFDDLLEEIKENMKPWTE